MTLRRQFVAAMVTFVVGMTAAGGFLAWNAARRALEAELDLRAEWVARATADVGLPSSLYVGLQPGMEDLSAWASTNARLRRLRSVVPESYIISENNTALVTSFPADSIPIGTRLPQFDLYPSEIEEARTAGHSTSLSFTGSDGRRYKWGFAQLDDRKTIFAVLMPADYLVPLERLQKNLLLGSIAAAVLAALLAGLLAANVVRPLERLSRVALRIQRGHMDEPVAAESGGEVGRLARAMERMRQGIQQRDEQLRLMLAQVAHEIRNPLGGLELFASAAAETEDATERNRLIGRVRDEVKALNDIINDFLTFARPMPPEDRATDVRHAIREAADLVQIELEGRGGTLSVDIPDHPLLVNVTEDHVKRAALNLLRNAAQVSDRVYLRAEALGRQVRLCVRDEGPGVPEALRERVFEPFVTDKEQGAGLGLAIVKKIAAASGGRVELADSGEANDGMGAEFRIYFGNPEERRRHPRTAD